MKAIALVFVVALLVRLLALTYLLPELNPDVDLDSYRSLARSLAAGQGFVAPSPDGRVLPNVARTPVYPAFLAALMRVGGDRLGWFLAVQCVLGAATCGLTVVLARRWWPELPSAAAGFLVAVDPNSVLRCLDLRTETLFTLLLLAGACLLAKPGKRAGPWLAAGWLWSLAALARPIAVWLWLIPVALALIRRDRMRYVFVFLGAYLVMLGIWDMRNYRLTGRWFVSTIATHNLLLYRAAGVSAEHSGQPLESVQRNWTTKFGDVQWYAPGPDAFAGRLRTYRREAWKVIAGKPAIALKQTVIGWGKTMFGPGARSLEMSRMEKPAPTAWWRIYSIVLAGIVVAAAFGVWRTRSETILLTCLVMYFVVLSGGPEANSRFRTPVTPLLAVLAVAVTRKSK